MPTNDDLVKEIEKLVKDLGSQVAAAAELEISPSHISDLLSGRRLVSDAVAKQLGYEKVTVFNKVEDA